MRSDTSRVRPCPSRRCPSKFDLAGDAAGVLRRTRPARDPGPPARDVRVGVRARDRRGVGDDGRGSARLDGEHRPAREPAAPERAIDDDRRLHRRDRAQRPRVGLARDEQDAAAHRIQPAALRRPGLRARDRLRRGPALGRSAGAVDVHRRALRHDQDRAGEARAGRLPGRRRADRQRPVPDGDAHLRHVRLRADLRGRASSSPSPRRRRTGRTSEARARAAGAPTRRTSTRRASASPTSGSSARASRTPTCSR